MNRAENYIQEHTHNVRGLVPWITPLEALTAAKIAKEEGAGETIDLVIAWLSSKGTSFGITESELSDLIGVLRAFLNKEIF